VIASGSSPSTTFNGKKIVYDLLTSEISFAADIVDNPRIMSSVKLLSIATMLRTVLLRTLIPMEDITQ
jgi:hypothetical protein